MSTAYFRHFSGLTAAVWLCPFRPFCLLTAGLALLAMIIWLTVLHGLLPPLPALGGMVIWHAPELIFGFAVASIAGFLLTAVPEFTSTRPLPVREIQRLVALSLGGRLSFSVSEWLSIWPAALCDSLLLVVLLAAVARPIWQQADRRHLAFIFNLIALLAVNLGFYAALASGGNVLGWLRLAIGVLMTLIVVALSRISMQWNAYLLANEGKKKEAKKILKAQLGNNEGENKIIEALIKNVDSPDKFKNLIPIRLNGSLSRHIFELSRVNNI